MNLSDIFSGLAHKKLAAVDLPNAGSNQHELNGVAALRDLFGTAEETKGDIRWRFFCDETQPASEDGGFTFYDARAKSSARTGRTEWRLYYSGDFLSRASSGDLFYLARTTEGTVFGLVFRAGSSWQRAAVEMFGSFRSDGLFHSVPHEALTARTLEFLGQRILDELDLDISLPVVPSDEALVTSKFGEEFPTTNEMSGFAREEIAWDARDCDETLTRWLYREEQLFRALEAVVIHKKLDQGFASVDDFIQYSLSVQNRRKARMGLSLQNHLAEIFRIHEVRFTAQARTERNNRPDFLFPGQAEYHDPRFSASLLTMLGVKSTSKDRWRQILTEAERIPRKHLCTLEPGISVSQTDEMSERGLTLVVPKELHRTYTPKQRRMLLSLSDFVERVRPR